MKLTTAVLVPCFNEEAAIGKVVADFRKALPDATVYVYDNNSTDKTIEVATAAGAVVRREQRRGKGNVVRRMFQDIEADVYVMVDGDDTYDASRAPELVNKLVDENLDMVVGRRIETHQAAYRAGHRLGNAVLTGLVSKLFGAQIVDMLSGYRVFSRRFAKSFPSSSREFEIETELTVHALELGIPFSEFETPYFARPEGSQSKLSTFRDGWKILVTIVKLVKGERPLAFFTAIGGLLVAASLAVGIPLWFEFFETGLVPRQPSAVLATGLMLSAFLSFACGLILDTVTKGRQEMKRLAYLALPSLAARGDARPG